MYMYLDEYLIYIKIFILFFIFLVYFYFSIFLFYILETKKYELILNTY